jgi:Dockerin type I domain
MRGRFEPLENRIVLTATGDGVPDGAEANFLCDPNGENQGVAAQFCQAPAEQEPCPETEFPDVNGDGLVTPTDALLLINRINAVGSGQPAPQDKPPVFDLNCDGIVTPADVMIVINHLNNQASAQNPDEIDIDALVQALNGSEGEARVDATNRLLDLGQQAAPALAYYGAQQISPVGNILSDRVDVVFSLISGLVPNDDEAEIGYASGSFGIRLEAGTTIAQVDAMGDEYGFTRSTDCRDDVIPTCYVTLHPGHELPDVLEQLLRNEESVISVNLNYYYI